MRSVRSDHSPNSKTKWVELVFVVDNKIYKKLKKDLKKVHQYCTNIVNMVNSVRKIRELNSTKNVYKLRWRRIFIFKFMEIFVSFSCLSSCIFSWYSLELMFGPRKTKYPSVMEQLRHSKNSAHIVPLTWRRNIQMTTHIFWLLQASRYHSVRFI